MTKCDLVPENGVNVLAFGADASGATDSSTAFAKAVEKANQKRLPVYIPTGLYILESTWLLPSDTVVLAEKTARIKLGGARRKTRGDFLLSNADTVKGNKNIAVFGGVWDGNNTSANNAKPDLFDKNGYSGAVLNFAGVENLTLSGLTVANSVTYNIRMTRIENFSIEDIDFVSDAFGQNQDGLHFGGGIRNGRVKNIRALSNGQTNDDLIALNADDSVERVENLDLVRGAIENITFENLFAENCHTVLRLLSVTAPIKNITIRNVYGGYRCYALNLDGARYCRTPLFAETDFPDGIGAIENVLVENMLCRETGTNGYPAICLESGAKNFRLKNFRLTREASGAPALIAKNLVRTSVTADGIVHMLEDKNERLELADFADLAVETTL